MPLKRQLPALSLIHIFGLQQGNKDLLREHYELYSQLDLDLDIDDDAKANFITALENAAAMLENNDAVQNEVDAADDALVAAAQALVKRGDKTTLQSVVAVSYTHLAWSSVSTRKPPASRSATIAFLAA